MRVRERVNPGRQHTHAPAAVGAEGELVAVEEQQVEATVVRTVDRIGERDGTEGALQKFARQCATRARRWRTFQHLGEIRDGRESAVCPDAEPRTARLEIAPCQNRWDIA